MRTRLLLTILVVLLGMAMLAGADERETAGANWPRWRGADGSGVSPEKNLPAEWSEAKNVLWKAAIPGRGHSSPIIWGDRIFLTTAVEGEVVPDAKAPVHMIEGKPWAHPESLGADRKQTLKVLALDHDTGKVLWERTAYEGLMSDSRHRKASFASPTPATDGEMVYAFFGTEGIYAYDFRGNLKWKVNVGKIISMSVGNGTSPTLYKNLVILQCDSEDGEESFITALDKKSGKQVWRVARKVEISWATPIVVKADDKSKSGREELITLGNQSIIAYDPATGRELWRMKGLDSNAIPSPVAGHGLVYAYAGSPKKLVMAIRPGGEGDITGTDRIVWTYDRGVAYVASPILYGDYLYLVSDKGILTCLDARTGQVKYDNGRIPVPATFIASLVAGDGKIFQFSEDGDTFIVKAGPEHEVLRTNSLGEPVYATPSVAGGRLYIRGEKHLYAIRAGEAAPAKTN
jgi:outer membrane protein assembly factor BamB